MHQHTFPIPKPHTSFFESNITLLNEALMYHTMESQTTLCRRHSNGGSSLSQKYHFPESRVRTVTRSGTSNLRFAIGPQSNTPVANNRTSSHNTNSLAIITRAKSPYHGLHAPSLHSPPTFRRPSPSLVEVAATVHKQHPTPRPSGFTHTHTSMLFHTQTVIPTLPNLILPKSPQHQNRTLPYKSASNVPVSRPTTRPRCLLTHHHTCVMQPMTPTSQPTAHQYSTDKFV